jgi:hypothetical protein
MTNVTLTRDEAGTIIKARINFKAKGRRTHTPPLHSALWPLFDSPAGRGQDRNLRKAAEPLEDLVELPETNRHQKEKSKRLLPLPARHGRHSLGSQQRGQGKLGYEISWSCLRYDSSRVSAVTL